MRGNPKRNGTAHFAAIAHIYSQNTDTYFVYSVVVIELIYERRAVQHPVHDNNAINMNMNIKMNLH